jgi:CubicO group peptidase (beta-lactamase class C family)
MRRRTSIIVWSLVICCFWIPLLRDGTYFCQTSDKIAAQTPQTDKIDSYITQQMQARRIPGLALAVVKDGKMVLKKAYGLANLETETAVKTNSVFELASVTKPFTATAIMMLVEEGKVQLDAPISTYLDDTPENWKSITVRHLLTHTAGFPVEYNVVWDGSPLMNVNAKQQFDRIVSAPLSFPAGERALYSDPGYILLGMIIGKAAGHSYRECIQKRIFEPLQMTDSSVLDQSRIIKNRVSPYAIRNGQLLRGRRDWQLEVPSNFGIYSTVEDLAKFDAAIHNGTLLKRSSLDQMWTPARLNNGQIAALGVFGDPYGFGWMVGDIRGDRVVEHAGFSGTHMLRFADHGLTIIVLTNLDAASGNRPGQLARGIAGILKTEYQPPHSVLPQTDPFPQTTRDINTLLSEMAEGKGSPIMTSAYLAFFNNLRPELQKNLAQQLKTLKSLTYITSDNVEGRGLRRMGEPITHICYYKGEVAEKLFDFTFWITKEGKVASLRFNPAEPA